MLKKLFGSKFDPLDSPAVSIDGRGSSKNFDFDSPKNSSRPAPLRFLSADDDLLAHVDSPRWNAPVTPSKSSRRFSNPTDLSSLGIGNAIEPLTFDDSSDNKSNRHSSKESRHSAAKEPSEFDEDLQCSAAGCIQPIYTEDYCRLHYCSANRAGSPVTRTRKHYKTWDRTKEVLHTGENGDDVTISWKFNLKDGSFHTVVLHHSQTNGSRSVTVDGRDAYNLSLRSPEESNEVSLELEFEILPEKPSRHKKKSICSIFLDWKMNEGFDYSLRIEGRLFADARIDHTKQLAILDSVDHEKLMAEKKPPLFQIIHAYLEENWSHERQMVSTKYGWPKAQLSWRFTINGSNHVVVLEHGHFSGKRKVILDCVVVHEKKLGAFQEDHSEEINITIDNIPATLVIICYHDMSVAWDGFDYNFFLDGVSFKKWISLALNSHKH